ncbi:MAG: TonB-dependent receptor [Acidobacteriota bacterium]
MRIKPGKHWLLLLLLTPLASVVAQQPMATIRVEVRAGPAPLAGANVTVNGALNQTDLNGVAITSTSLGKVEVLVSKLGFFDATASLSVDQIREWTLSIELQPRPTDEESITVYATRTGVRLQDEPTRVEVLTHEEIEEKAMMTPGDIVMLLNEMGGLRVQTTSPSLGAASIRIQGMRGRYTRFLSDGLPLFGQQGGGLGILQIPPTDLGQVEVVKGVSSALYGAGAMAGVINLISRRPGPDPIREVLLNRSSLGATDISAFFANPLAHGFSATVLASGNFQQRIDRDHDGWADLAGYSRAVLRPRLFWNNNQGASAFLTGGITFEDRAGGTMPSSVLPATNSPYREALDTRRYDLGGNYQFLWKQRYIVTTRLAANWQNHRHQFGESLERDRHEMFFGEVSLRGTFTRKFQHTWVAGFATERDAYRPRDLPRFAYLYITPGLFFQDDIQFAPWFSLSASARADFHNQFGAFLSPRLSALFRPTKKWTSRLSAGQGFFAPTPLTEETEAAGLSRLTIPTKLTAERGRSASFDLTREIGHAALTATLFASKVTHPIQVTTAYTLTNAASPIVNLGTEFLATYRKAPFSATASYTYVNSPDPLTPRHAFGLTGMWEKEDAGRIGVECYYTGVQRLEQNPYRSKSRPYYSVGFLVERKVHGVRLFFNAENLTDSRQTRWDPLLRPTRASDGRWTVDAWAPLDGRVVNGGVRFLF